MDQDAGVQTGARVKPGKEYPQGVSGHHRLMEKEHQKLLKDISKAIKSKKR